MVGCKDEDGRFFKDHLDELPRSVIVETQRRNQEYVKWLASHLFVG